MEKIIPTWGYKSDGTAKIFDLEEGENLPEGWANRPEPWHHPNTAHLYTQRGDWFEFQRWTMPSTPPMDRRPQSNEPEAVDMPPKPRRGRPRKSETS
jgi:hypothetical protein